MVEIVGHSPNAPILQGVSANSLGEGDEAAEGNLPSAEILNEFQFDVGGHAGSGAVYSGICTVPRCGKKEVALPTH
jgi:hypothetical protein